MAFGFAKVRIARDTGTHSFKGIVVSRHCGAQATSAQHTQLGMSLACYSWIRAARHDEAQPRDVAHRDCCWMTQLTGSHFKRCGGNGNADIEWVSVEMSFAAHRRIVSQPQANLGNELAVFMGQTSVAVRA